MSTRLFVCNAIRTCRKSAHVLNSHSRKISPAVGFTASKAVSHCYTQVKWTLHNDAPDHARSQHQKKTAMGARRVSSCCARCSPGRQIPSSSHILATASVDLLHLGDVRLQSRRAVVSVARALKRRRPVVLQRRQVRRPQVSQVPLVVLLRAAKAGCGQRRRARGLASAPAFRNRQARLAPVSSPGQTSSSYGGTSSLSPKLPMPPSMPMPPMPPMPPIPPA